MPQKPKYKLPDISSSNNAGKNIARLRKQRGISQKELSEKIGISQALLSHYETERLNIPVEIVIQIAISLSINSDTILGLDKNELSKSTLPSRKILQRMKQIEKLPSFEQKSLLKTIDTYLKAANIE
jgi:transcriptional regulator with XRE-family HTH domain